MNDYEVSDIEMPIGEKRGASIDGYGDDAIPEDRKALVKEMLESIESSRDFHKDAFKRMREDIKFARNPLPDGASEDNHYCANLVQRHIQQRTSSIYAKNPRASAKRRERLFYRVWDGKPESLMQAQATMMAFEQMMADMGLNGLPVGMDELPPEVVQAQALLQEVQEVEQQKQMLERTGKTLEILFHHSLTEQVPLFKTNAKQLVRRTVETGVGYIKLGFQRAMERSKEQMEQINDLTRQMERLEELAGGEEGESGSDREASERERLKSVLQALQSQPDVLVKEGLVYAFPRSTAIIVDKDCTYLKGFVGANFVAEEYYFSPAEIKALYGKDLKKGDYTGYDGAGVKSSEGSKCRVYEFYDRRDGLMYTLAEGYCDFLEEPQSPPVRLERFFPYFVLSFNDLESSDDDTKSSIYPPSDVRLMRSHQLEYNRSREGLREHRIANRPQYGSRTGALEDKDKMALASGAAHEVIELNVPQGQKVEDVIGQIKKHGIDPNLYDTSFVHDDMNRTLGTSEPQFGGGAEDATATAVSVGESARVVSQSSAIDDLDDLLTELARDAGVVMLQEYDVETVKRIAGPGAVWPELSRQDVADEIWLEIEAGSSGKPNRAAEVAMFERMVPLLVQIPGISPNWLAREAVKRLDDRLDLDSALAEGVPSITAMNRQMGAPPEAPAGAEGEGGPDNEQKPTHRGPPSGVNPQPGEQAGGALG